MKKRLLLLPFLLSAAMVGATVNPDNGNYHIKNTDFLVMNAGLNVEISRTYNSRSSYISGLFGVGWSSELEGYIRPEASSISYFEAGGGNVIRFDKVAQNKWESTVLGRQTIMKVDKGYVLSSNSGKSYVFDMNGRLLRLADNQKNFIELKYNQQGVLSELRDNFNNQVKITTKAFAGYPRITLIERNENKARYEYDSRGNLVKATGMDAVPYVYAYDDQHNLTKITYQNGMYKELAYNKLRDWVIKYRDVDGLTTQYDYFTDSIDPENKFGTAMSQFRESNKKEKEQARFWYEFKVDPSGKRYKYRSVSMMRMPDPDEYYLNNGKIPDATPYTVTETFYTKCCGTPLSIATWSQPAEYKFKSRVEDIAWTQTKQNKIVTKFDYYNEAPFAGFLKEKLLPNGVKISVKYDKEHRKISEITRGSQTIQYGYDKSGQPVWISDLEAKLKYQLSYGSKGEISKVEEENLAQKNRNRTVLFRYNGAGQPVEIKERHWNGNTGSIKVQYTETGRVAQILSGSGREVASKSERETARRISQTFSNLVELLRPVGLSLGPEG